MTDFNSTSNDWRTIDDIEFLDTSDAQPVDETDLDEASYHATKMSLEEVQRIDDLWKEPEDVDTDIEPYRAKALSDNNDLQCDINEESQLTDIGSSESLEDRFASDIEAMSFDDLKAEQERLDRLSQMNDMDIFAEYDAEQKPKYDPALFDSLTDGLSREALEHLKEGLASGDQAVYDYFGLKSNDENDTEGFTRVRKL